MSRILLHVGAPKCGSSALQTALSQAGRLVTAQGEKLVYTAARPPRPGRRDGRWLPLSGARLRVTAARLPHGYAAWPGAHAAADMAASFAALDRVHGTGTAGLLPVVSQEGWIDQSAQFAAALPHWFAPGAEVIVHANARPPLEWINAAWWQWGVWGALSFDRWLERGLTSGGLSYRLGSALQDWAALPGVRLDLDLGGDAVAGFAARHGLSLPRQDAARRRNAALPPALVGFLLRNRRFRPTVHDSAVDFTFQRWCGMPEGTPRLWALAPRHVARLRAPLGAEVDRLLALVPEDAARAAVLARPGWRRERVYAERLAAGPSRLHVAEEQAQLHAALLAGVVTVCGALGGKPPALPPVPGLRGTSHADRDAPMAEVLEALMRLDARWRKRQRGWI